MKNVGADAAGMVGVMSTLYSWIVAATAVAQFVAAVLGVIATALAIYLYIRKIRHGDNT